MNFFLRLICLIFISICIFLNNLSANPSNKKHNSNSAILENNLMRVSIDTCDSSSEFGRILSLYDKKQNSTVGNNNFFGLRAGSIVAYKKKALYCSSDSLSLELSNFGVMNITALMDYILSENRIILNLKIICHDTTEFSDGINLDFESDLNHLTCSNHLQNIINLDLDTLQKTISTIDLNQITQLSNSINKLFIVIRNPFQSHFVFNNMGTFKHTIQILQLSPSPSLTGSPNAFSKITANDTIYRSIEINIDSTIIAPVFFSEHPYGLSNSITMYWDELPNRDNWAYMTSDTATDTKYMHFFVKLLNAFPSMKMGFLLLPDRILSLPYTYFKNWSVNSSYIISDTLEKKSGNASLLMLSDSLKSLVVYQKLSCSPNTPYSLTYYLKTENIIGSGVYGEVYADTHLIASGTHFRGDNNWLKSGFDFKTRLQDTSITVYLRIQDSKGWAFFDDINLSQIGFHSNLLQNPGFEIADSGIMYDNPRRHWVDAHGPYQIITKAPQSYIDFLKSIENHTLRYGWENRVELGVHGYHHSPSLFEPDPKHEFCYYDPEGDSLRINKIISEYYQSGLTSASLKFIRPPGMDFSKSIIDLTIDKGFVYFNAPYTGGQPFNAFMLKRNSNIMWMVRTTWWADYDSAWSTDRLIAVLNQGHIGDIGGHPEAVFYKGADSSYQRLKKIFDSLETRYPNVGYLFPDEYADNATSIYNKKITTVERQNKNIVFQFHGTTDSGNTVVYLGTCDNVLINGKAVNFKIYNGTTYAILPKISEGDDTLLFINAVDNIIAVKQNKKNVSNRNIASNYNGYISVFNLRGQKICTVPEKIFRHTVQGRRIQGFNIPSGMYIVKKKTHSGRIESEFLTIP
jgi:hypothetical protein